MESFTKKNEGLKYYTMIDIKKYDQSNVFAKILSGEIPCDIVYEDNKVIAFKDIKPQAPIHIVVIPKDEFCSLDDFSKKASPETITYLIRSINIIAEKLSLQDGYRVISNVGTIGGQEVPHTHIHILSGKKLGRIIP